MAPPALQVRLAEIVALLSQATDLAWGQPREYALPSCLLALRLAHAAGATREERSQVYYHSLLRYLGCNAETSLLAAMAGDDIVFRSEYVRIDGGRPAELIPAIWRSLKRARPDAGAWEMARMAARSVLAMPRARDSLGAHCEVAQRLAARLGFGADLIEALGQLYERWDGKGAPKGVRGEALAFSTRIVALSQDAMVFHHLGGPEAARAAIRKRTGTAYDPRLTGIFDREAAACLAGLDGATLWEDVLAADPGPSVPLSDAALDAALGVLGDFSDVKSAYTNGHSQAVAALAEAAGKASGLPDEETCMLRRAGLVHGLGRVGVSAGVWDKPAPLRDEEREQVRQYPYHTERLLSRCPGLLPLAGLAGKQAERLDGSGYHRGLPAAMLPPAARILSAAHLYRSLLEMRAWREAFPPEKAAEMLQAEATAGRLDREAVKAVLAAAGQGAAARRTKAVAGLSERETEVLGLLARGNSMQAIAEKLCIAKKTVDRHIQNVYGKIGVSTRAAAALFAAENHLL